MININRQSLNISLPQVHPEAMMSMNFQRTLRIPDDNRSYPLPAGLGEFPLRNIDEFPDTAPKHWNNHGGVLLPMYQSEAMWINFSSGDYPFAVKIAAGKINAVTGEAWDDGLDHKQNYVVLPYQPWLDGFSVGEGLIRQFVAQPLGQGFTAEEQLTGNAEHGGLQIQVFAMKAERYEELKRERAEEARRNRMSYSGDLMMMECCKSLDMGLAPGGLMKQNIEEDYFGLDAWETSTSARCFVHIANSETWQSISGAQPPTEPVTAEQYAAAGIPWFDYYRDGTTALQGSEKLAGLDSVATKKAKQGIFADEPHMKIDPKQVVHLGDDLSVVREGQF
jgi:hypothetical protein